MRYACYAWAMETISHRELRNNSGQILERVRNGETLAVTNHGELTAVLVPPHSQLIDQLVAAGRVSKASDSSTLGLRKRVRTTMPTSAVLDELRGDR